MTDTNFGRTIIRIDVYHDADFDDAVYLPLDGTRPRDLTGKTLELTISPSFDYDTPILVLSSADSPAGITIDEPLRGGISFFLSQFAIQSTLPIGEWVQFLTLLDGTGRLEIWRGPFMVNPGRRS